MLVKAVSSWAVPWSGGAEVGAKAANADDDDEEEGEEEEEEEEKVVAAVAGVDDAAEVDARGDNIVVGVGSRREFLRKPFGAFARGLESTGITESSVSGCVAGTVG
jgi:hypothetical protein